jgi:hypothetical protein
MKVHDIQSRHGKTDKNVFVFLFHFSVGGIIRQRAYEKDI